MIELEDILKDDGPERRVDNHLLVLYLGKMKDDLICLNNRFNQHMKDEEVSQEKVAELIELLNSFKGFLRIVKWLVILVSGAWAGWIAVKEHIKW